MPTVSLDVNISCLTLNIEGGLVQRSAVLDELVSKHGAICLLEHILSQLSLSLLDTRDKLTCCVSPAEQNKVDGRPLGGLVTDVNSILRSLLVESCDYSLAVKIDNTFIYNVSLPSDYHNDASERFFVLASEKLYSSI